MASLTTESTKQYPQITDTNVLLKKLRLALEKRYDYGTIEEQRIVAEIMTEVFEQ